MRTPTLDERHSRKAVAVTGPSLLHSLEELVVDIVDDLHVSRQEVLDERDGPLLQSFGQDGVVGVAEGSADDVPGIIEGNVLLIDQDALQLDNSKRRVSVVELDGHVVGYEEGFSFVASLSALLTELAPRHPDLLPSSNDVAERSSSPEVL